VVVSASADQPVTGHSPRISHSVFATTASATMVKKIPPSGLSGDEIQNTTIATKAPTTNTTSTTNHRRAARRSRTLRSRYPLRLLDGRRRPPVPAPPSLPAAPSMEPLASLPSASLSLSSRPLSMSRV
jgi:hypothetical protein